MRPLNPVVAACPPSGIRRFFDIAASMDDVISLGVGEPDYVTPWRVREAGIAALEHGLTTYTSNAGLLELREAVCADLDRRYRVSYQPAGECLVTAGVSEGLDLALRVLLEPGDEVLIPDPCYVAYGPCVAFAGGTPVYVATSSADGFRLHADAVEAAVTPRTKAILLGSPANPTGAVQNADDLAALTAIAVRHDLYLVSDEIYERLSYAGPHTCLASLPGARDRTVLLGGFSKAHAMTGWRLGFAHGPTRLIQEMAKLQQFSYVCAPSIVQKAGVVALDQDLTAQVDAYRRKRDVVVSALDGLYEIPTPGGAFYAFPRAPWGTATEFVAEAIRRSLLIIPGNVFSRRDTHFRISYAVDDATLARGLEVLKGLARDPR